MWFCVLVENKKRAKNLDRGQMHNLHTMTILTKLNKSLGSGLVLCKNQKDYLNVNGIQIQRYI